MGRSGIDGAGGVLEDHKPFYGHILNDIHMRWNIAVHCAVLFRHGYYIEPAGCGDTGQFDAAGRDGAEALHISLVICSKLQPKGLLGVIDGLRGCREKNAQMV